MNKTLRLAVVWALRTRDRAFLRDFYPWRRLQDEAAKRSLELRFLFPEEAIAPDGQPARMLNECQAVLLRGMPEPAVLQALSKSGLTCINTPEAVTLAGDKLACARWLARKGWPTPAVWLPPADGAPLQNQDLQFPCVVKPRSGSRGRGVQLVHDEATLRAAVRRIGTEGLGEALCQDYIAASHGRELRCFVIAGQKPCLALRTAGGTALAVNSASGGSMRLIRDPYTEGVPRQVIETSGQIIRDAGLVYGTVDWLFTGLTGCDALTICELNASPGFEALEAAGGGNIAGAILDAAVSVI